LDEVRGETGAEGFRIIQDLIRSRRYQDALDRAILLLERGHLGRKQTARVHNTICWLYVEGLGEHGPMALLHGEETVRLAGLVRDPWTKCEALALLIKAYCRSGDVPRAEAALDEMDREIRINPKVITGGQAVLHMLRAMLADAKGDHSAAERSLHLAESMAELGEPQLLVQIQAHRVGALLDGGKYREAQQVALQGVPDEWVALEESGQEQALALINQVLHRAHLGGSEEVVIQCLAIKSRVLEHQDPHEARCLAQQAYQRAIAAGRVDLTRQVRARVAHLLEG
jgi:pentatricopeptide repeat protein